MMNDEEKGREAEAKLLTRRDILQGMAAAGLLLGLSPTLAAGQERRVAVDTAAGKALPDTITEAGKRLRDGSLTCKSLTAAYLACIIELNPKLNAFITVTSEQALAQAEALDKELKSGKDRGPLHGIPICHKDLYDTAGILTTIGSEFYKDRVPKEDATVVRLLKEAGAITLGKANMSEFATGSMGFNKAFGDIRNPWDTSRAPGSSSGGSAAAVAAGLCLGATGSDTGGSVRHPASICGIATIRPTYGLVSLAGCFPRAFSLDAPGPFARRVADVAILLNVMAAHDPRDPYSIKAPKVDYTAALSQGVHGLKLGVVENFTFRDIDPPVEKAIRSAIETFAKLGAEIVTLDVPVLTGALDFATIFSQIQAYEFYQILGKLYESAPNKDAFQSFAKADLETGKKTTRETYEKAQKERPANVARLKEAFKQVDALLSPTMPWVALPYEKALEVGKTGKQRRFNLPISYAGLPAVSVPCGFSPEGLPAGLQIIGNHLQEALILRIAAALENATDFHKRRPPVYCAAKLV